MRILVADDELLARKRILKLLESFTCHFAIYEASNGKEAIDFIKEMRPDLVFLDIQMTDMTGFDVLRNVPKSQLPLVIFVTAYDQFAVQAFDVRALDFLLKPYKKERFEDAFKRACAQIEANNQNEYKTRINDLIEYLNKGQLDFKSTGNPYMDKIVLKLGQRYHLLETVSIKYATSSSYYAEIFTINNQKFVHRISMTDLMKKLNPDMFIRISRSCIVNLDFIKEIVSEGLGGFSVVMKDGHSSPLSKNYKNDFLRKMDIK